METMLQAGKDTEPRSFILGGENGKLCNSHQLATQYQMLGPKHIHTSNVIQTEQVVFMYLGKYMYLFTCV